MEKSELDGKKVRFRKSHPHAGETGTIIGTEQTIVGVGYVVELEDCQHRTERCFMFKEKDVVFLADGR